MAYLWHNDPEVQNAHGQACGVPEYHNEARRESSRQMFVGEIRNMKHESTVWNHTTQLFFAPTRDSGLHCLSTLLSVERCLRARSETSNMKQQPGIIPHSCFFASTKDSGDLSALDGPMSA